MLWKLAVATLFTYALRLDEWLVYFYAYAKYYYGFQRRKAMYLDDSNYAYESVKSAHTEPVLVADKKAHQDNKRTSLKEF